MLSRYSHMQTLAKLINMGDHFQVVVQTQDSSLHTTSGSTSLHNFLLILKHVACSPAFLSILLALCLATSTINILIHTPILFQWLAFLFFAFSTCVFCRLIVTALVFSAERYLVMRTDKALYFVFALKTSVHYFFCSSSILLSWMFFIKPQMGTFGIHFVTSTLATFVIATAMWMFKIVILKVLDCRFHDKDFFQNMHNQISHEYVLQTLLRPTREFYNSHNSNTITDAQFKRIKGAFANTLRLVCTRLHTISDALDSNNIGSEHQVEHVISTVFKNLTNSEHRDILEADLLRVMKEEEKADVLRIFQGAAETKSINEAFLRNWMESSDVLYLLCSYHLTSYLGFRLVLKKEKVRNERKLVVHLLKSTSTVIEELNKVVLVNLYFLVALVWCLLMGFGATRFVVFISSDHLLLLVFIFGNFCKMICEGIMLAIVVHPFDIGDHCIIDKEQLVIEKIGLISTVLSKNDNRKVECLNSVLLTKFISNLNRSSELADSFDILVSSTTSADTTSALKLKIEELLGSSPGSWRAEHCLELTGIDDSRPKYNLVITYARKFQNYNKKKSERAELIYKLRMLLEELNIQNFTIQ